MSPGPAVFWKTIRPDLRDMAGQSGYTTSWGFGHAGGGGVVGADCAGEILAAMRTRHRIFVADSRNMGDFIPDSSVHLVVTSPPYWNAKNYSQGIEGDLGNVGDYDRWCAEIGRVWAACHRVLCPGRKMFINIMNLPKKEAKSFRTINLVGHTVDLCERIGFIYKREIVWHKTNGVKAPFGSYPYPGGILINNMHEQILEFEKPGKGVKYSHLSPEIKEASRLPQKLWLSIKNSDVWLLKPYKSGTREHLAPFPEEIPRRLILAYSFMSETVLDPFAGLGTVGKVAVETGRNSILYEINPGFLGGIMNKIREARCPGDYDVEVVNAGEGEPGHRGRS